MFALTAVALGLLSSGAATSSAPARPLTGPVAHAAATCAEYPNQAAAQRAHDTILRWVDPSTLLV